MLLVKSANGVIMISIASIGLQLKMAAAELFISL